jgi:hypothetical protein
VSTSACRTGRLAPVDWHRILYVNLFKPRRGINRQATEKELSPVVKVVN